MYRACVAGLVTITNNNITTNTLVSTNKVIELLSVIKSTINIVSGGGGGQRMSADRTDETMTAMC